MKEKESMLSFEQTQVQALTQKYDTIKLTLTCALIEHKEFEKKHAELLQKSLDEKEALSAEHETLLATSKEEKRNFLIA